MREISEDEIRKAFVLSNSITQILANLGLAKGGCNFKLVHQWSKKLGLEIPKRKSKYKTIEKVCPICDKKFLTQANHKEERTTCSHSCSNRFFRTKHLTKQFDKDTVIYNTSYRTKCLNHYDNKCAFCDWDLHIEVHHIDRDRSNNDISNLIPLCPNHHWLTRLKKYRDDMDEKIRQFKFKN